MAAIVAYDFFSIDACLDDGGSFDYGRFECDFTTTHPVVPYLSARVPVLVGVTVALAVFFYVTFKTTGKMLGWDR
jgi:hypothetical protein